MAKRSSYFKSQNSEEANQNLSNSLVILFNQLQQSPGFKKSQARHSVSNSTNGLLLTQDLSRFLSSESKRSRRPHSSGRYNRILSPDDNQSTTNDGQNFEMISTGLSRTSSESNIISRLSRNNTLRQKIHYENNLMQVFENYAEQLNSIFVAYSSMGEPTNTTKLKSIKFLRMLKDAGILKSGNSISQQPKTLSRGTQDGISMSKKTTSGNITLSPVDADMIFTSLTGTRFRQSFNTHQSQEFSRTLTKSLSKKILINHPGHNSKGTIESSQVESKLEFETFLKAIELIAEHLYPTANLDQSVTFLIENHLLKLTQNGLIKSRGGGIRQISNLKELLSNQEVIFILGKLHENIQVYFKTYSDQKGLMNFSNFLRFYKDFEFFPQLISKSQLSTYFYALASLNRSRSRFLEIRSMLANLQKNKPNVNLSIVISSLNRLLLSQFRQTKAKQKIQLKNLQEQIGGLFLSQILFGIQRLDNSQGRSITIKNIGSTRALGGYNWSLMRGLIGLRKQLLEKLSTQSSSTHRLPKQMSFQGLFSQQHSLQPVFIQ